MDDIADRLTDFAPDEIPGVLLMLCAAVGGDWNEFMAEIQDPTNSATMSEAVIEICAHAHYAIDQLREWAKWLESNE